jgi:Na+/proline symporter
VVGAFWPLVCGLYWKRSTTQGAIWSIVLGMATWGLLSFTPLGEEVFPSVLGGFIMAGIGMVVGSLLPTQGNRDHHARRHRPHHPHHAASA